MIKFILSIDAGGSNTQGAIEDLSRAKRWTNKAASASLSHDFEKSQAIIKQLADSLLQQAGAQAKHCLLVCGAAGAALHANAIQLTQYLGTRWGKVAVVSDAKTSLYGASQGTPMVVVAVGTGSVAMRLNADASEQMFGGWGFIAGDLGSGAFMGRLAICRSLIAIEQNRIQQDPLVALIATKLGIKKANQCNKDVNDGANASDNRESILAWLKQAEVKDYAALTRDIFNQQQSSPLAQEIVQSAAQAVQQLIDTAQPKKPLKVAMIGGLGEKIAPFLSQKHQSYLVEAKGDAIDGGFYLARKLLTNMRKDDEQ